MTASSADAYDGVTIAGVRVQVNDNDTNGVTVSETALTVTEGGTGISYTVVLDTLPIGSVVIAVSSGGDVTVDTDAMTTGNQNTLTFTSSNWNTAQTVTVAAAEDTDDMDDAATISHMVVADRSIDEYDAVTIAGVSVTVIDDEAKVIVSLRSATAREGGSTTYTVVLDALPTSDVVVMVTSSNMEVTVSPAKLTFTTANGTMAQTVTVTAAEDADAADDAATITHMVVPTTAPTLTTTRPTAA